LIKESNIEVVFALRIVQSMHQNLKKVLFILKFSLLNSLT